MSPDYLSVLDDRMGALLGVEFKTDGREVTDYAVVLLLEVGGTTETIRVYDGAHGHNEMHRYTRSSGKQPGTRFAAVPWVKACALHWQMSRRATAR